MNLRYFNIGKKVPSINTDLKFKSEILMHYLMK